MSIWLFFRSNKEEDEMIGFYHIKDGMSVCYNQLAKLDKSENVNTEVIGKICKALECKIDDIMEFVEDKDNG